MNKNGWGLRAELAFLLLFLICILISTIGLHRLGLLGDGGDYDISEYTIGNGTFDYDELENKVVNAAKKYYNEKYPSGNSDTVVVNISTLKNKGYMSPIYDSRNKECRGYAKILNNGNCVSYIKCSVYKTPGYSDEYE